MHRSITLKHFHLSFAEALETLHLKIHIQTEAIRLTVTGHIE